MAQLDFYANEEDILSLVDFMFEQAPMRLFEAYSKIDHELREFSSSCDIRKSNHIEDNHGRIFLRGWWETVTKRPYAKKIQLVPKVGEFRYQLVGVGSFQILQGEFHDLAEGAMNRSVFSHWNEAGARERANESDEDINEVNWKEFRRLSGKIHRNVRNKMPVAKLKKRPILPGAYSYLQQGGKLFGLPGVYNVDSNEIIPVDS